MDEKQRTRERLHTQLSDYLDYIAGIFITVVWAGRKALVHPLAGNSPPSTTTILGACGMEQYKQNDNCIAIPPGATIQEQSHTVNGKADLTYYCALRLDSALELPAWLWDNVEADCREKVERIRLVRNTKHLI
ncbi:hypothetical protein AGMMS49992_20200 [Clostridia bacterium]|nr:hypothetical protein AGMMS49992_20200 [Clostridia bacterium]